MKTQGKKRYNIIYILAIIASFFAVSFGYSLNIKPIDGPLSCPTTYLYLEEGDVGPNGTGIHNYRLYLDTNMMVSGNIQYGFEARQILTTSWIGYYSPLPEMIKKQDEIGNISSIDNATFIRTSRVFPYNIPVRSISSRPNKVVFEQPVDDDATKKTISIQYNYDYRYALNVDDSKTSNYRYNQVSDIKYLGPDTSYITTLPGTYGNKSRQWSEIKQTSGCKNIEIHRCGDGNMDISNIEIGDLYPGKTIGGYQDFEKNFYEVNWFNSEFFSESCDEGTLNAPSSADGFCRSFYCEIYVDLPVSIN